MAGYFDVVCVVAVVLMVLYYYFTATFDFWKARGIPGPEPIPVFGNVLDVMLGKVSMGDYLKVMYDRYKGEPMFGIFTRRTPILVINDPELIKDVLIKDFSKFSDRGLHPSERTEPLSQHLFSLEPKRWRPLRTRMSPIFTSGKLKEMFPLILECSNHLETYLKKVAEKGEPVEFRELTAKFTTDVIGSCAFGIEMNALSNEESEFRKMGREIFAVNFSRMLRLRIRQSMPWLYNLLGFVLPHTEVTKFFTKVVKDTMEYRKKHKIVRHDFINMMLELQEHPDKLGDIELTDVLIAAQVFVFFTAGFETSSTTMSHALYELALNHEIQDKLRAEIKEEYIKNGGDWKYETVKDMAYLDKIFRETLRKYPPATFLMRQAVSRYVFEGSKVSIPEDQRVWIPIYAIQRDPNIYPNPDVFDPERFSDEVASARHPMFYLPFGDGPRNCIGARFAVFQTKIGLIKILLNCKVDVCEKTTIPYKVDPNAFLLAPKDGIHLKIIHVDKS